MLLALRMMTVGLCTVFLVLAAPVTAYGQSDSLRLTHYTINDGLSQSSANALLEDQRGFLWIGTQDGLNRFDGYEFLVYRHDNTRIDSLASNNVASLYESRDGTLWVGTTVGTLHAYDRDTESFRRYGLPPGLGSGDDPRYFDDVRRIIETADGRMWVGSRSQGLWEFDRRSETFRHVPGVDNVKINALVEAPDGVLWIGTDTNGLLWHWPETGKTSKAPMADPSIYAVLVTSNGEIWAAGNEGIITRYSASRERIAEFSINESGASQPAQVRAMLEDQRGRVWIGSIGGGLQTFSLQGQRLAVYKHQSSDPYSLKSDTVFSLLLDRSGVLWAGTLAAGISKVSISGAHFENYWHQPENPASLGHSMVNEFAEDRAGNLWVGTNGGGVDYFDRQAGTFTHFRHVPGDPTTLSSDRVWGMYLAPDDVLWVGTWGAGLNKLDIASGKVTRIAPAELGGQIVTTIVGDGDGGLWVGMADGGIVRKRAASEAFEPFFLLDADVEKAHPVNISVAYRDSVGRLWVGTWNLGLCMLPQGGSAFDCYAYDSADPLSLNDNNVRAINEDADGNIWIATANGIARFNETSRNFARFDSSSGLPKGTIYGIVPGEANALWLSSNQGLYRFDVATGDVRSYQHADGLQANEFNGAAYIKASDGTFFFGGIGGITGFRPENLARNHIPPKVAITGLRIFNETVAVVDRGSGVLQKSITETRTIRIPYTDNVITIEYTGLHFVNPELNRYAHQLVGFDRDWVHSDAARRSATYTNLAPGEYEFRVRAANSDGVWSSTDSVLGIAVLPPWWMTWWARGGLLFAILTSLFLLARWRVNLMREQTRRLELEVAARTAQVVEQRDMIEKQAKNLEELLESKNRFFARLSHEFRTPITLMLGPVEEQLEHSTNGSDRRALVMARRNGRRLLHLVNQLLSLARSSGEQSIDLKPVNLSEVARVTADSFLPLVVRKELELAVNVPDDVWVDGNAEGLQIVVSNLMSNAIKYTDRGGRVSLAVAEQDGNARIEISDTGIGIPKQHLSSIFQLFERGNATGEGSGIGLTLARELVEAHAGTIEIHSSDGHGTTVTVEIPSLVGGNDERANVGEMLGLRDADLFVDTDDLSDESPEPVEESSQRPRILVVEDNRDMRDYVRSLLEPDYQVLLASDGVSGVDIATNELPDLVISDVMMPKTDGFELLRELRSNSRTSHIPVIMLTALDDQDSRLTGLAERADDYVVKPFNRRELLLRVRNILELARIRARRIGQLLYMSEGSPGEMLGFSDGLGQRDREFLKRLEKAVETHYQDAGYRLEQLADNLFMSPRQLQRKMKALLDTAPAAYLRDYRLKRARALLLQGRSVSDVAFATGFSSVSYFGRCFKSQFGTSPSEVGLDSHNRDMANVAK